MQPCHGRWPGPCMLLLAKECINRIKNKIRDIFLDLLEWE